MNNTKTGPRDVFMHLLGVIGLYVIVISFGALVFQLIDIAFPDVLRDVGRYAKDGLRWPLSVLVIVFPLYAWLSSYLQKDLLKNPETRELKTRKWMLYFTLFISTIVIVSDLITLIYRFLEGDLTTSFILKVITVLLIACAVFLYYGWNLKKEIPASKHPKMKFFIYGVIVIVGVMIVTGFIVAGSPKTERMRRFDDQRVMNLQSIQNELVSYWRAKEVLPQSLDGLRDDIRGFIPPTDPETKGAYEYTKINNLSFELCATFKTSNKDEEITLKQSAPVYPERIFPPSDEESFIHDIGRTCFERTIDPDKFPPYKNL